MAESLFGGMKQVLARIEILTNGKRAPEYKSWRQQRLALGRLIDELSASSISLPRLRRLPLKLWVVQAVEERRDGG